MSPAKRNMWTWIYRWLLRKLALTGQSLWDPLGFSVRLLIGAAKSNIFVDTSPPAIGGRSGADVRCLLLYKLCNFSTYLRSFAQNHEWERANPIDGVSKFGSFRFPNTCRKSLQYFAVFCIRFWCRCLCKSLQLRLQAQYGWASPP